MFTSELGRILHEQARPQLGIGWSHCDGFTVAQIQRIDFDRVDLSEFTVHAARPEPSRPGVVAAGRPARQATRMRERIGDYYERNE